MKIGLGNRDPSAQAATRPLVIPVGHYEARMRWLQDGLFPGLPSVVRRAGLRVASLPRRIGLD